MATDDGPTSRKVQLAGGSTFTVSLPKAWAREHGVDAGTEVTIRPYGDGTLLVQVDGAASGGSGGTPTVVTDDGTPVPPVVRALYAAGYDEVELAADGGLDDADVRAVRAAAADLVGLSVRQGPEGRLRLNSALEPENVSVQQTSTQLRRSARSGFEAAVDAAVAADAGAADEVAVRRAEADRLRRLVERSFRRALGDVEAVERLGLDRRRLADHARVAGTLARVAGHAATVASAVEGGDDAPPAALADDVEGFAREAVAAVDEAAVALLDGADREVVNGRRRRSAELVSEGATVQRRLHDGAAPVAVGELLARSRLLADAAGDLSEAALTSALEEHR
jgi:phosphate uptake regulator